MNRRRFLATLGLAAALPLLTAGTLDTKALPMRRARFIETREKVKMVISLPDLLPSFDKDAMEALESGFATRLVFELGLYRWDERTPMETHHVEVRIFKDVWLQNYRVDRTVDGGHVSSRTFSVLEAAVREAVALRAPIAELRNLDRGKPNFYVVRILAQRNPTKSRPTPRSPRSEGQGRDLEWFSRWVGMFVRSRPAAEQTIEVRSNAFFLALPGGSG